MKSIYLLLTILSISLYSCKKEENITPLTGIQVEIPESFIGIFPIACKGDTVLFKSYSTEFNLQIGIVDKSSMSNVLDIIRKGNGPQEMMNCAAYFGKEGQMFILDTSLGRVGDLYQYRSGALTNVGKIPSGINEYFRCTSSSFAMPTNNSIIFAGDSYDHPSTILTEVDYKNDHISSLEFWPFDDNSGNELLKLSVYTDNASIFSDGKGLYAFTAYSEPYMFIFSVKNKKCNIEKFLFDTVIKFSEREDGLNYRLNVSSTQLQTFATPNSIFVLQIDMTRLGLKATTYAESNYGNLLYSFNWKGEQTGTYRLDHIGKYLWVNDITNTLYLMGCDSTTDETMIWSYELPENN